MKTQNRRASRNLGPCNTLLDGLFEFDVLEQVPVLSSRGNWRDCRLAIVQYNSEYPYLLPKEMPAIGYLSLIRIVQARDCRASTADKSIQKQRKAPHA